MSVQISVFVSMVGFVYGFGLDSCQFVPNLSLVCIEYWDMRDMRHGCISTKEHFEALHLTKHYQGQNLIGLDVSSLQFQQKRHIWVRFVDGYCKDHCCGKRIKKKSQFNLQLQFTSSSMMMMPSTSCISSLTSTTCINSMTTSTGTTNSITSITTTYQSFETTCIKSLYSTTCTTSTKTSPQSSATSTTSPQGSATSTTSPQSSATSSTSPQGSATSTTSPQGSATSTTSPQGSATSTTSKPNSTSPTTPTTVCSGNPCLNGATCLDMITQYICVCAKGFSGTRCQTGKRPSVSTSTGQSPVLGK